MARNKIIIIGGGPSGLLAACILSADYDVTIYEKEKAIGKKFLIAGKGGLNITNKLAGEALLEKYTPKNIFRDAIADFDSKVLRKWLYELGIDTFEGSSGKIFPVDGVSPASIVNILKKKFVNQGGQLFLNHEFVGFSDENGIKVKSGKLTSTIIADYYIFALGGASWPVTGSTGEWIKYFEMKGIQTEPFQASNCGVVVSWPNAIKDNHSGKPLKNISISTGSTSAKGEVLITENGLEGHAVYPLVPAIRQQIAEKGTAVIELDFKPFNSIEQLLHKVEHKTAIHTKKYANIFNLSSADLSLIKSFTNKESFLNPLEFVKNLKSLKITIIGLSPIEEAISTVGGISVCELNCDFSLKKMPEYYAIGEMVDWDAPTGGFLLQGCFSMGHWVAKSIQGKAGK